MPLTTLPLRGEDQPSSEEGRERGARLRRLLSQHPLPVGELCPEGVEHLADVEPLGARSDPLERRELRPEVLPAPLSFLQRGQQCRQRAAGRDRAGQPGDLHVELGELHPDSAGLAFEPFGVGAGEVERLCQGGLEDLDAEEIPFDGREHALVGGPQRDLEGVWTDPGNPTVNFHGERRSNATHASTTDPEARLMRKGPGKEAKLVYHGHALMENRHGLVVDTCVTQAVGTAEREAAAAMATNLRRGATVAGDKGYDTRGFVAALRSLGLTPHVAQNLTHRRSAIDARTTRHPGYAVSQQKRKLVEEVFGWLKTVALFRKTRHRGVRRVGWLFTLGAALYNLVRIRNLIAAEAAP